MRIRLKEIRKRTGMTQEELARRTGMTLANVQRIEHGRAKSLPLDTLEKFCVVLSCQPNDLFTLPETAEELQPA